MNLRRPATLAVTLAALLAATLPASAEDNLYNPDPTRCDYVTIAISNNPDAAVNPGQATEIVRKDCDGLYKFHLKVEVHPLRPGQTVTIKSIRIKCKDDDSNSFDVVPPFTPPSYDATVEIPPDKARGTTKWCVEVTTESSTTNPPAQGTTTTNDPCEKDFTIGDCTDCSNCNTTGDPTVSNDGGGFTADMPLGRSDGGDTTGSLRFRTKDMSFPGLEGISVFVPSSVAVERTLANQTAPHSATNKFVKISFATLTTNIEAKPTVVNNVEVADSITITHTLKNATQPFRTTTISKITESGITWLRADSTLYAANGTTGLSTIRHQQKKVGNTYTMQSGPFTTGFTMLREVDLTITPDTQSGTEVHREIVRENDVPVSDIKTTWGNFSWGWEKIEEIIDPDGYPLTSSWTYYMTDKGTGPPDTDDAGSEEGYGRIETYVRSDGYMETHYYWHNNHTTILPFAGAQQGLTLSRQWNDNHTTRTTTRTVGTKMLSEESESYTDSTTTPSSTVPTITTTTKASSGATLTTTTTLKPYSARFGGQPASVLHPDGTLTTYEYTYAAGIKTVTMNTGAASNGSVTQGKSTTTTYNSQGFITKETVSDIASEVVLSVRDAMLVDLFGRVTKWAYDNDTEDYSETTYGCCGVEYERARDGTVTNYFPDALKRIVTSITTLGTRSTTTGYTYGATEDDLPMTTVSVSANGTSAGSTTTVRDLAGRTVSVTSPGPAGTPETTQYAYSANGLITTVTHPDGGTVITESHPDGKTKSVSGSAAIHIGYLYDTHVVNGGGLKTTVTTAQGVGGVQTSYADLAGRVFKVDAAAPNGGTATTITSYNGKGQVELVTSSGHPAVKYIYDDLGVRVATWTNRNGDEDFNNTAAAGTGIRDSWTGGITDYLLAGSAPSGLGDCRRTRAWVRLDTNPTGDVPVSTTYQSVDGLRSLSKSIGVDWADTTTVSTRPLNGSWTSTTTYPDATSAVSVTTMLTGGVQQTVTTRKDSNGDTVEATTTLTDALGRTSSTTSGRGHLTNYSYYQNGGQIAGITQVDAGPEESDLVTSYAYTLTPLGENQGAETATRTLTTTLPDNTSQYRETNILGQTLRQWGSQINAVAFGYDAAGRMTEQTTYRAAVGTSAATFPAVAGDTTKWLYHPSGALLEKEDPDTRKTTYIHDVAGRVLTRTWARAISTTDPTKVKTEYGYYTSGQLGTVTYYDGTPGVTPGVTHTYDRLGRPETITQANRSKFTYTYAADLGPDTETIQYDLNSAPGYEFTRVLDRSARSLGRDTGWDLQDRADPEDIVTENTAVYGYNSATGRLQTVGNGIDSFTYGYVPNSIGLLETVTGPVHTVTNTYDATRDTLASVQNKAGTIVRSSYDYTMVNGGVNNLGQRMGVQTTFNLGGAHTANPGDTAWGYDNLGQLTSANHGTVNSIDRAYRYDTIGNRLFSEKGAPQIPATPGLNTTGYTPNALNQYDAITPYIVDGENVIAGTPVAPVFDDDGNMTHGPLPVWPGANCTLVWDAENRLVEVKDASSATLVQYTYDALSRRIASKVGEDDPTLYLYDGWNCIAEYTGGTLSIARTWGLDLSGSLQGAGGVGGLLAEKQGANTFYPAYDGNGNVSEYLEADGDVAAHFEYDPYGNIVKESYASGFDASSFTYKFSTKPLDLTTGLYYYGYRYYDPLTGRWPSRDPIEEMDSYNLYGFVGNEPIWHIDVLGLVKMKKPCPFDVVGGHTPDVNQIETERAAKSNQCDSGRFYGASCGRTGVGSGLAWPTLSSKQSSLNGTHPGIFNNMAQNADLTIGQLLEARIRQAEAEAPNECSDSKKCCSKIVLKVNCLPSNSMDAARKYDPLAKKACDYRNSYDCPDSKGQAGGRWENPVFNASR